MSRNKLTLLGLVAALVVLAADQASKWWILDVIHLPDIGQIDLLPVLNLTMVWNRGVTFGLLNGSASGATSCSRRSRSPWWPLSASGFAAPNPAWWPQPSAPSWAARSATCIDRLRFGAVVDFIHAHVGAWSWYVFNLADAAIVCGVAALVLDSLLPRARIARPRSTG